MEKNPDLITPEIPASSVHFIPMLHLKSDGENNEFKKWNLGIQLFIAL